mmetsp:Transcript_49418/g.124457  ORF Transcript_49418/g.124457 Transcript_49418/m.124457 type:complete len:684 (-) Transcript_49418:116-2167(-)
MRKETYACISGISDDIEGRSGRGGARPLMAVSAPASLRERGSMTSGMTCSRLLKHWPVLDPDESSFLGTWDIVMFVQLIIIAFLTPFETAFLVPRWGPLFVFDRVMDALYLVDMGLELFTAYPDPVRTAHMVRVPRLIIRNYLGGWFWFDLIGILPFSMFEAQCTHGVLGFLHRLHILRLLRLVRLLRLTRVKKLVHRFNLHFGFSYAFLALVKFSAIIIVCCHWMACLWGHLGQMPSRNVTWLTALRESKGGPDELYDGPLQVYSLALYWAIITLTSVGYGDITPQTVIEYWAATLCTSVMAGIWAYVIGAVCGIVSTMEPHEMTFKQTMDDLNWLMSSREMPHEMCLKLRRYFHETREMNRRRAEMQITEQMSPMLQGEFALFSHQKWIEKVWYLRNMPHDIIVFMSRNLKMAVYSPNEEVFSDRTLFIVRRGICALSGKILVTGDIWGEDMLLSNDFLRSKNQARSLSYLSVLMLHVEDMVDIVANFPEARARLRWSQVQIAIVRGIQKIAEVTRELDKRGSIKSNQLSDSERMDLFVRILQGRYSAKALGNGDPFGVEPVMPPAIAAQARRNMSCHSLKAHCPSMTSSMSLFDPDSEPRDELDDLRCRVRELTCSLANIGGKVDRLLASSLNSSSRNNLGADLGPLVISQTSFNMNRRTNSSRCLLGNVNNSGSMEKFG